jgi:adenylylsulfate kinase
LLAIFLRWNAVILIPPFPVTKESLDKKISTGSHRPISIETRKPTESRVAHRVDGFSLRIPTFYLLTEPRIVVTMSGNSSNNNEASTSSVATATTISANTNDVKATNVTWHAASIQPSERQALRGGHGGAVVWFTGLSGCGKSSIANAVEVLLVRRHKIASTYILDGDNIRLGLNQDLGFTVADRVENIRRIGETAKLMAHNAGLIVLTAFISPYRSDRDAVRTLLVSATPPSPHHDTTTTTPFIEIYVNASLATCEIRDPKGLYQKARAGQITNFTGIDDPYEAPLTPELVLDADGSQSVDELAEEVVQLLINQGILPPLVVKPALLEP